MSVAPKKSASDLRTGFLSQKTLEHFCLHFRKRLPSIQELELLKHPLEGRKIGNCWYSCPEQAMGGFLLWEMPNCYFEFKIRTVGFGGYFFVVFLISPSCRIGMFILPTWLCAAQSLCCRPMQQGIGEYLKVKVLLEMVTVSLNLPHKAWSLR